ncbi:unnamed protein product [Cylicocyclus nassatus]|uniref:Uncharacterized protein n=1 Tax=Cylicocyclus nassatus TaxID=53992 RepID=A0AA36HAC3_CYLNA|nr:unnamed protein product [Cylicocyclus nassatus]
MFPLSIALNQNPVYYSEPTMTDYDDIEDEPKNPTVTIAFEYVESEETFNFYIRRVSNAPFVPSIKQKHSRAALHVVRGISRKTWMGTKRTSITWEDVIAHTPESYRTLAVPHCITTIFNEFFSCKVAKKDFHNTLLKIQFCDVGKDDFEVPIADCDYWIDTNPIERFREYELPLQVLTPDLGELELSITYLMTAQRVLVSDCRATNLIVDPNAEEIHVRAILFVNEEFEEIHKTEEKSPQDETPLGITFGKRLVFDLMRIDVNSALFVCQVVQKIEDKKRVIGQCEVKAGGGHWSRMLAAVRQPVTETYRLRPAL